MPSVVSFLLLIQQFPNTDDNNCQVKKALKGVSRPVKPKVQPFETLQPGICPLSYKPLFGKDRVKPVEVETLSYACTTPFWNVELQSFKIKVAAKLKAIVAFISQKHTAVEVGRSADVFNGLNSYCHIMPRARSNSGCDWNAVAVNKSGDFDSHGLVFAGETGSLAEVEAWDQCSIQAKELGIHLLIFIEESQDMLPQYGEMVERARLTKFSCLWPASKLLLPEPQSSPMSGAFRVVWLI